MSESNDATGGRAGKSESTSPRPSLEGDLGSTSGRPSRRKKHTKSRNGCKTCKQRKVKCDERRPSCSHCNRLKIPCQYNSKVASERCKTEAEEDSWQLDSRMSARSSTSELDLLSLELLHSYIEHTSLTLPSSTALRDFWRITVPRLALQNVHVMKSLLALTALHKASCQTEKRPRYIAAALEYHHQASQEARTLLKTVTPENGTGLFLFSALTVIVVLNVPKQPVEVDSPLLEEMEFIQPLLWTIHGIRSIRDVLEDDLRGGHLAPLAEHCQLRWHLQFGSEGAEVSTGAIQESVDNMFNELQERLACTASGAEEELYYHALVGRLREAVFLAPWWEEMDLFVWLYRSLDEFSVVNDLPTQNTLVIWAHLAVIIKMSERQWWLQGWAEHIMASVYKKLDRKHRPWVYGAALEMGWIIPDY